MTNETTTRLIETARTVEDPQEAQAQAQIAIAYALIALVEYLKGWTT